MEISSFVSGYDGLRIEYAVCRAEKPAAVLQISHGMAERKERYFDFMRWLAENGVATYINDHRGHGASVRSENELGYFGENGADALISDLHQLAGVIEKENPGLGKVMLGHSMGALAARIYAHMYPSELSGLMILGNPGYSRSAPMGIKAAKKAQIKGGRFARSRFLTLGIFLPFVLKSPSLKSRNAWICTDSAVVKAYDDDPKCGFEFSANGYEALLTLMQRAKDDPPTNGLKAVFMSGEKDPCMVSTASLNEAAAHFGAETKIWKGMRHELLNETGKERVWTDILGYILKWTK